MKIARRLLIGTVFFALGYLTRNAERTVDIVKKETLDHSSRAQSQSHPYRTPSSSEKKLSAGGRIWNDISRPTKERFSDLLSLTDSEERESALQAIMENLNSTQAPEIVAAILEARARGIDCGHEWKKVFENWGQIDPEEALSFLNEADTSDWGRFSTGKAIDGLMRGWGRKNPVSALASIDSGVVDERFRRVVFESWIQDDYKAALARMTADSEKDHGDHGRNFDLIATAVCRKEGLEGLIASYEKIKSSAENNPELQRHAAQAVVSRLNHAPVDKTVGWLLKEALENPELGKELVNISYQNIEVFHPNRSMELLERLNENSLPIDILRMPILTETRRNPERIGKWLNEHVGKASLDPIRASYVQSLFEVDPVSARKWAETISDPELRAKSLEYSAK